MPKLCVEYSKSARAKCSLTSCGKKIQKNELRIGTEVTLPFNDDGVETWKWRHLCCFTERQLNNARGTGDIGAIEGEDTLAPADKALVQKLREGKLVGDTSIIGRVGDIANSKLAVQPKGKGGGGAAAKAKDDDDGSASPGEKRARAPRKAKAKASARDDDVDSEATDEYEVAVEPVSGKPRCPYGAHCFRTNPEHFQQFSHDSDAAPDVSSSSPSKPGTPTMKPVIKRKKTT